MLLLLSAASGKWRIHVECGSSERWAKDQISGYESLTTTKLRSSAVPRANELK